MDTLVLDHRQINQKLDRIAYEIVENNPDTQHLILVGIHGNGFEIVKILAKRLKDIQVENIQIIELKINKKDPLKEEIVTDTSLSSIDQKTVILVDDVINSGRTMQYALMKILERPVIKVKTVALVDRKHRSFPIRCDFVGLTLSTTLQDRIEVELNQEMRAFLV
ncbi:phosphoribosyltransferase [Brumimicrobium salinarum]|uniref:Phosphoribosyltransferase n=1 Tax=Brumimicrobium salinarum TaxID=2058658 RepID=A0A2I0R4Y2_9FLAO|nr:phosphoribosyltransferase family protein [Brumimicrobium salinarum]PKR81637.1 phosphoribosyltransferase [Brumimicrobium salinarum]